MAAALCDGRLDETFRYDPADPLSLADVTIYVPTRRSARVLRSEFVDLLGGRSAILPVIRPLGETDDDSGYFDLVAPEEMDLALPIGGTARLLELGRLILAWRNQLPKIVLDVHSNRRSSRPPARRMPSGSPAPWRNSSMRSKPKSAIGPISRSSIPANMRSGGS